MDLDRNPDFVEQLAWKYMQKCKVESSTESESDNNEIFGQGLSTTLAHGTGRKTSSPKLQLLDPYDGDSEETSSHSDSSLQDQMKDECDQITKLSGPKTKLYNSSLQGPQDNSWDQLKATDIENDICMMSPSDLETSLYTPGESWHSSSRITGSSDPSMDSGVLTEPQSLHSGHFLMIGVDARTGHHYGNSVFPTSMTSEENSDLTTFESSMAKRKLGVKMDYSNEKLRRKKARVTDIME